VAVLLGTVASAANVSIQFDGSAFRVNGWNATAEPADGWTSVFSVYAGEGDVPAMAGSYTVENRVLIFEHYRAVFKAGTERAEAAFDGPPRPTNELTRVERIYPSTDVFPSNTLRFYIYFSAPMSRGEAYQHIHLIDADNNAPVEIPFLELEQELWDQNNQRLTVLFDPGRIKRGLVPTNTIGPPVVEGKHYKLVVDREWHDARGVRLVKAFERDFRGGPSDRVAPEPKNWRVTAPKGGSTEPLVIRFPKPMDYVLLQRMIGIFDSRGEIHGRIAVDRNETEWRFTPDEAWKPGAYHITADNTLEDIAGNHLDRPFDVDVFETVTKHITTDKTSLAFSIH